MPGARSQGLLGRGREANPMGKKTWRTGVRRCPETWGRAPNDREGTAACPSLFHTQRACVRPLVRRGMHTLQHTTNTQNHPGHVCSHPCTPSFSPSPSLRWQTDRARLFAGVAQARGWAEGDREGDRGRAKKAQPRPWVTLSRQSHFSLAQGPWKVRVPKPEATRTHSTFSPASQGRMTLGQDLSGHQPASEHRSGCRPCWLGLSSALGS